LLLGLLLGAGGLLLAFGGLLLALGGLLLGGIGLELGLLLLGFGGELTGHDVCGVLSVFESISIPFLIDSVFFSSSPGHHFSFHPRVIAIFRSGRLVLFFDGLLIEL
jgi:hypothetical protein